MFGKLQFRDERGEIDLTRIERKVIASFDLARRHGLDNNTFCRFKNLLCSETMEIKRYYEQKDRKEIYRLEIIDESYVGGGCFDRDRQSYTIEIHLLNSVKHV